MGDELINASKNGVLGELKLPTDLSRIQKEALSAKVGERLFLKKYSCAMYIFKTRLLSELECKAKAFVSKTKIKIVTVWTDWKGKV